MRAAGGDGNNGTGGGQGGALNGSATNGSDGGITTDGTGGGGGGVGRIRVNALGATPEITGGIISPAHSQGAIVVQ
jgi:hypothetical protein